LIRSQDILYEGIRGVPHIREPGSAVRVRTGAWRVFRPVWDMKRCVKCKQCWLYCPESAISWPSRPRVDYGVCKGCAICAQVCPAKAITMVRETREAAGP
jgi:2-oxoacid:acceptor oxidoreductase delta subunit (pyruvate/2-ketoisovalerate family)